VRAQSAAALQAATFLASQPKIERVHYAGLRTHPQHALAARQMSGFGGLMSFEVAGGREGALRFVRGLQLIGRATSLGGVESLIEHRASVEGPDTTTPPGLLRFSVGLESEDDLIADLRRALDAF
jgi:cystathionine gamma-synthase